MAIRASQRRLLAVVVAATATLLAPNLTDSQFYTYEVAPCVTAVTRTFSATDGLLHSYEYNCQSSDAALGTSGSAGSCTRGQNVLVVQFLLPQVSPSSVTGVTFNARISSSSGGGVPVVLHGEGVNSRNHRCMHALQSTCGIRHLPPMTRAFSAAGLGARALDMTGSSATFHGGHPMNQDYGKQQSKPSSLRECGGDGQGGTAVCFPLESPERFSRLRPPFHRLQATRSARATFTAGLPTQPAAAC